MPEVVAVPVWFAAIMTVVFVAVLAAAVFGAVHFWAAYRRRTYELRELQDAIHRSAHLTHVALVDRVPELIRPAMRTGVAVMFSSHDHLANTLGAASNSSDYRKFLREPHARAADICLGYPSFRSLFVPAVVLGLAEASSRRGEGRIAEAVLQLMTDEASLKIVLAEILSIGQQELSRFSDRSFPPAAPSPSPEPVSEVDDEALSTEQDREGGR